MMAVCIKQHLSDIWNSIHEKFKQHWGWVKKECQRDGGSGGGRICEERNSYSQEKYIFDLIKKHEFSGILNIAGIGFQGWHTQKSCFVGIKFSV